MNNNISKIGRLIEGSGARIEFPEWPKIVVPHKRFGDISFDVVDVNHVNKQLTLWMSDCISEGFEFDAPESNGDSKNHQWRERYGSGNYAQSAIRQYINADGYGWWQSQTSYDEAPSYVDEPGFLAGFPKEFVDMLIPIERICATNNVFEYGMNTISQYSVRDKMFLPSFTELTGRPNGDVIEGRKFNLLDKHEEYMSKSDWYFQRSCNPSNPDCVWSVSVCGNPDYSGLACYRVCGFAAACVIQGI